MENPIEKKEGQNKYPAGSEHAITLRPSPTALLDPTCDVTFKTLFTDNSDEARLALKSFLEAVLDAEVSDIQLRPTELPSESLTDKDAIFDVVCTLNGSEAAEIEMQNRDKEACYDMRAEYYAAHLLNHCTKKGGVWADTPKVFQISVLNFLYDKAAKDLVSVYNMRTADNRHLSDRMTIVFIELPKTKALPDDVGKLSLAEKWCKFFLYANDADKQGFVRLLCESEEGIMAANMTLAKISEDEANWYRETARMMAHKDYMTGIVVAERRGMQQGLQQGIQQGMQQGMHDKAVETAKNLLQMGLSHKQIVQATGLPLSEITAL